jgi:hypothetical protein
MVQIGHAVLEPNTIFALPLPFPLRVLLSFSPAVLFLPGDTVLCKQKCAGRHTILTASLCRSDMGPTSPLQMPRCC